MTQSDMLVNEDSNGVEVILDMAAVRGHEALLEAYLFFLLSHFT